MRKVFILIISLMMLCGCEYLPFEVVSAEEAGYYDSVYDNHDTSNHYHLDYNHDLRYR